MAPLTGFRFLQVGGGPVERAAGTLLARLGAEVIAVLDPPDAGAVLAAPRAPGHAGRLVLTGGATSTDDVPAHGVVDGSGRADGPIVVRTDRCTPGRAGWAASGAMALTGRPDGPRLLPPGDVATGMHAAATVVELLSALGGTRVAVDGPALLGERAALSGRTRAGRATVGGAGRLLRTADGWVAVSLPRSSDRESVPAWLGSTAGGADDPWPGVTAAATERTTEALVRDGQLLGLAVAALAPTETRVVPADEQLDARGQTRPPSPYVVDGAVVPLGPARPVDPSAVSSRPPAAPRPLRGRSVLDLSALWAGPLATALLAESGATVTKVESTTRPDGAREGEPRFFALLDQAKEHRIVDLSDRRGVDDLRAACAAADLVVEASRPRALDQLGVARRAPWLSITAYGRTGPWRQWVGFGDDAAAAGGLVAWEDHEPRFLADAAADPAAGLHAAAAALAVL
ncbi:MAG: CoA transferase, partial [Acidimicrobiales bacterium]|nr:CoA transferase [Acidimicrobiales bacterium]